MEKILQNKNIHDRFLRNQDYRESRLLIDGTQQKFIEIEKLAK